MKTLTSPKKTARIAGLLYLVLIVCGVYAEFFVRANIFVSGDAVATIKNIQTHESLFRMGFISDLLSQVCYFLVAFTLYTLFKSLHKNLSLLFLLMVCVSVAILCLNMLHHFAALMLATGKGYSVLTAEQLQTQVLMFLDLHRYGYLIAQIFYGAWLLPLGYLVFKSTYFPKIIGIFLMLGSVGYLIDFTLAFLLPAYRVALYDYVTVFADIGEFSLCLWLLIVGVRMPKKADT